MVLVDSGYLLGAAATEVAPSADAVPSRKQLKVNHQALIEAIIAEAHRQSGLPVLRVIWYDAAEDGRPTQAHRALQVLPDVKIRLGTLARHEGRVIQKGVDALIQKDLTTLARNHAVCDVMLISGDADLVPGVEEAQEHGVKVHLWGVEAGAAEYNQSLNLMAAADRRWVISTQWLAGLIHLQPPDPTRTNGVVKANPPLPNLAVTTPAADDAAAEDHHTTTSDLEPESGLATPADLARLADTFAQTHSRNMPEFTTSPPLPRLREITSGRQAWKDNEDDATAGELSPADVGDRYGRRWVSRATGEQHRELKHQHPLLPKHIDTELLKYAIRLGVDTWEDDEAKVTVRRAAWEAVLADR